MIEIYCLQLQRKVDKVKPSRFGGELFINVRHWIDAKDLGCQDNT